jgi:SAM-dependent methyltransferase
VTASVPFCWEANQFDELVASCHREEITPYILRYLEKRGPILEAGCGLGRFVVFLEQQGFRDVRGIDISPDAIGIVKKIAPSLNVTCADVSALPFEDSSVQGIISLGVVEHFEEGPRAALQEFQRVMSPGATALITVPFLNLVRRVKQTARIYDISERIRAMRASDSAIESGEGVVGRTLAHLRLENSSVHDKLASPFIRWPATGPFFEYRFAIKQFEKVLVDVGLSVFEIVPVDVVSGMFYEFGALLVHNSAHGTRSVTRLGRIFQWIFGRAPWVLAHMLLFVVQKNGVHAIRTSDC